MCGIAGIISADPSRISNQRLKVMTDTLIHRGPEGEGFWMNGQAGFGFRRLCIIDLSPAGNQPMHYLNRYTIIYNGEIYNYLELKDALKKKGYHFVSSSDTEVLLAAYACYKEDCLQYLDGMFAFAIWDQQEKTLFAARDRFGEKPFFYYHNEKELVFASEIKALWASGADKSYDGSMLLNFIALGWTEHPRDKQKTFYKNILALAPGHCLKYQPGTSPVIRQYWRLAILQVETDPGSALNRFSDYFLRAVERRLRSDVPVGTSLSGGIDSSSIIAAASRFSNNLYTHKSFSAVFPGYIKDESDYIKLVAQQYQLDSYYSLPAAGDLANDFSHFIHHHEQPVRSASVYAQYKVYQLAKHHNVTVLLDGQGADEMLGGYEKYFHWYLQELWATNKAVFRKEKKALRQNGIPFRWDIRNIIAAHLPGVTAWQLERKALSRLRSHPHVAGIFAHAHIDRSGVHKPEVKSLNDLLYFNTCFFGLGELLRYADSNSMAHSREVRLPYLSHELASFVFSLPATLKIHDGWSKWILRKTFQPSLPHQITWRKEKVGFEPPQHSWMSHPEMQQQVKESKSMLVKQGILNRSVMNKKNQPPGLEATDVSDWRYLVTETLIR